MEVKQHQSTESTFSGHNIPQQLEKSLNRIAKSEGFITSDIFCRNIATNGGSYMGILYRVNIKGKTTEGEKELDIFVKNIFENEHMKIYSVSDVFSREAFAYKELYKIFIELQDEANIPSNKRFKMAKTYEECNTKSILLEDLSKRGFKVYYRMDTISFEYAKLCVQQIARFHALSMILKEKRHSYYNEKVITMQQPFIFGKDWHEFVKNMVNYSINCLEPDIKKKVEDKILAKVDDYPKYMCDTSGLCTLCHGDFKHTNVMAKEDDSKVTEVITIDFQILHYGCPVLDFLYLIFNGTDRAFRRDHLMDLKDLYYETLEKFMEYFEMDLRKIYPRTEFERVYKEKLDYGLMINVFYVPFLFAAEDDVPDVANQTLSTLSFKVDKRFTEIFRGIVDDFIQWGYL